MKVTFLIDTSMLVILAVHITVTRKHDTQIILPLVKRAVLRILIKIVFGDKGHDDKEVREELRKLGIRPLIKHREFSNIHKAWNARMSKEEYNQKVKVESVNSSTKRKYHEFLKKHDLISNKQFMNWSSTYFEGTESELGMKGYSRDHRPDKKQITFGIATGINNIPTALTIQKGNVQDKKHFKHTFNVVKKVLEKNSLLIFDCGGNTRENKRMIMKNGYNYLTLKAKHKKTYKKYDRLFQQRKKEGRFDRFEINNMPYECVKVVEDKEIKYIFFSEKLKQD